MILPIWAIFLFVGITILGFYKCYRDGLKIGYAKGIFCVVETFLTRIDDLGKVTKTKENRVEISDPELRFIFTGSRDQTKDAFRL
jgi:hypothetical protein